MRGSVGVRLKAAGPLEGAIRSESSKDTASKGNCSIRGLNDIPGADGQRHRPHGSALGIQAKHKRGVLVLGDRGEPSISRASQRAEVLVVRRLVSPCPDLIAVLIEAQERQVARPAWGLDDQRHDRAAIRHRHHALDRHSLEVPDPRRPRHPWARQQQGGGDQPGCGPHRPESTSETHGLPALRPHGGGSVVVAET